MQQKWHSLEDSEVVHVIPDPDIKPHGIAKRGDRIVAVAAANCPCGPKVSISDGTILYPKPIVTHQSFLLKERIRKSMARICG